MALSRPPLSELIKNKLAITPRNAEHTVLGNSPATAQTWTVKSSLRTCLAFKQVQGPLTTVTDLWHGSLYKPRVGNLCPILSTNSPKRFGCMLSLPQPQLFYPESGVNNLWSSTDFAPKERMLLRSCLEKCYLEVDRPFVNQKILFFSCSIIVCKISPVRETLVLVYNYLIVQQELTLKGSIWAYVYTWFKSCIESVYEGSTSQLNLHFAICRRKAATLIWD